MNRKYTPAAQLVIWMMIFAFIALLLYCIYIVTPPHDLSAITFGEHHPDATIRCTEESLHGYMSSDSLIPYMKMRQANEVICVKKVARDKWAVYGDASVDQWFAE